MSADSQGTGRFLPIQTCPQWLDPETADALLAYAIENEARFKPAGILYRGDAQIDRTLRNTGWLDTLGPFQALLESRALNAKPELERAFGVPPFKATRVEIELLAYGDDAHFGRHIDTFVVVKQAPSPRVLTLVLYLHRRPAGFTGGALRFHALGGSQVRDVVPEHNLLVAFPAIAPHSVEPVACPGGRFADSRFAVIMWIQGF